MGNAYQVSTTVGNVEDEETAVAIATDWLRDILPEIDVATVHTNSGVGETEVMIVLRVSDSDLDTIEAADGFTVMGEAV